VEVVEKMLVMMLVLEEVVQEVIEIHTQQNHLVVEEVQRQV
jgi:hypothetical protein